MTRCTQHDVVVSGAGVAGLSAARALLDGGLCVRVLEARDRVGGRLLSRTTIGGAVDLGASWSWPGETHVQALVHELGLLVFPQHLAGDAVFEPDARGVQRISGNPIDVPSERVARGAQALALGLAARLPDGTLHLREPVAAVQVEDDGVLVHAASGAVRAQHVVLALPPALAVERIAFTPSLPDRVRSLAESTSVWMGGVVKAVAVYDRAFWREAGLAGAAVSHVGAFRELHDHSGPDGVPAALFGFAPSEQLSGFGPEQVEAAFVEQLVRLFGTRAAAPHEVHMTDWSREQWTSPAAPSPRASTSSYSDPQFQQPVHGRLHWASTETAPAYAGHVEGAIRAGLQAARAILQLQRPTPDSAVTL